MNKPDPRPVFSQLGKKSPNSRTPPSKTLLRPSGCALVLLMLAAILTPGTQVQAQTCTGMVGEVRILDGNAVNEGRLEICADKPDDDEGPVWGTVCDDYWTTRNANVACRQLGYTHAQSGAFALLRSHFGPGTGPILLDDIVCNGNEPNLLACPTASGQLARNVVGKHNCKSNETVGIRCLDARTDATLNNLSVRDGNSVVVNLNPEFASARDSYTASVPHTISTVTVFATPTQSEATVEYLDGNDMSLGTGSSVQIQNLAVGATVIKVKVTATDGMTEMVYSVTLNRAAVVNPPPNNPATGQPAINGTLRVDQTLTSTSGTIADVDGLTNAVYEYQWIRVDSSNNENEIFGATGSTYVLTTTDEGQRIRVKARFIDDRSNSEMRTSGRTETVQAAVVNPPPNNPATGQPAINGTLRVDQTLTSTSGTIADVDGLTNAVYEYQWIRVDSSNNENEIFGATGSTYVLTTTDEGQRIRVKARFIDDRSNGEMRTSGRTETVQAAVVNPPPNNPATGQPAINGTLRVDQTLTSTSGTIADVDGLTNAVYEYQWIRVDSSNNENEIFGATGSTYVLTTTDEGQRIRVKARFIDDRSNSEMRTSGRTETVQAAVVNPPPNNPATGQPAINGTLRVDQTLTSTSGTIADVDGLTNAVYEYQWIRVDSSNNENEIFGATGSTYVLTTTDEGQRIRVKARFIDDRSNGEMRTSGRTETVQAAVVNPPPIIESPVVTLLLTPQMISEDEGVSTVTAIVSPVSSEAFTVSVSAGALSPAVAGDFMLAGTTLSFAANATQSTGTVTITAVDNAVDAPDKMVRVSGTVSLTETDAPVDVTLIITDDEEQPTDPPKTETPVVTLLLTPQMISEDEGVSTVTAIVSPVSSEAFTVSVSAGALSPAIAGDFMLAGTTLSFAANATQSTGTVTITAVDNAVDAPDKMVRVSGTVSLTETDAPVDVTLIITDDEEQPTDPPKTETPVVTLLLTPQMISEDEGVSTVTAIVSPVSSEAFTVSVSAGALSPAIAGDFMLAGTTLSFAANATKSTGTVTITAVDNAVDAPDKMVRVSGTVSLSGADAPVDVTLIITDEESSPVVTLMLTPQMISEDEGVSTVTAMVSPASSEAFTVTVSASAVSPAIAGDFMLAGTTLSFAANATQSTGTVTITAVDNAVDAPDKMVRVSGTVSLTETDAPVDVTLIITDDEEQPTDPPKTETPVVTLLLTPQMISEDEGVSTVTAIVSPVSSEAFTVSVSAGALSPAIAGDFMLAGTTLSFAANATKSTGTVTITAVDNAVDSPDKMVRVSGTVSLSGADAPVDVTLIITDEESSPVVTLMLTPQMISEDEGVSTVTAMVSPASSEAFTVTVSASAVSPAVAGDFMLTGTTLSFAANATKSTGGVTITAVDNAVDSPDKMVRVSGTVSLSGADAPVDVTLIITDEESSPVVTLLLTPQMISEDEGVSTVTAMVSPASSEAFTVTVSASAVSPAVAGDFMLTGTTLSFAANATKSTGTVTITAVDNAVDSPDKMVRVSGTVSLSGADAPVDVTLIITDEESSPVVTLLLTPQMISEDEGVSTVTAMVSPASSEAFTVTVSTSAISPALAGDFMLTGTTLSFAANATKSTGTVTITAVDNAVDSPDKMVRVSGTVSLSGADAPVDVTLIITDEESSPVVTLLLTPQMISEDEGVSTVTATVSPASSEAFTVSVSALAVSPAVAGDFMLTGTTLSFAANATKSTGTVTLTAVDNAVDAPDKMVRVSGTVSLSGADAPMDVTLHITDEDLPPPELRIADATGPESGGPLVFGVSLNRSSEEQVTIDYTTVDGTAKAGVDYQAVMGTLTISAGVNHGQIEVKPLTDVLHEEDESFMIVLSNVSGAILVDGEATGLITGNDDRVTVQWLARFGRTAADHVLGAVEDQLWTQRSTRTGLTVAGQNLTDHGAATNGGVAAIAHTYGFPHGFGGGLNGGLMAAPLSMSATNGWNGLNIGHATDRNLLMSNALNLSNGSIGLGCYSLWGSGSHSRFDGSDDKLKLQGEVSSATVGSDYSCGSFLLGVALSHSSADGTIRFGDAEAATVESTLTGLYPYLRYQVSERFWFWGVTGYGTGDMTSLSASGAEREDVGLTTLLVAGGARGDLLSGAGGFSLSMKADAMVVRTRSEEDIGVIVAEGDANRRRVGLEGSHVASFENNSFLRSHVDLSLRHDSGDADKGFGLEVGGGLDWHGLMPGLTFNAGVRGLITHGADEFEEWGYSGGLRYDPTPASSQGLLLGITRSTGAPLHGGLRNTLWAEDLVLPSLPGDSRRQQQINAEFSYGFETLSGMGLPWARVGLSGPEKEYRLGYRMFTRYGVPSLEMGKTWYGRDLRLGWEFQVDCQAQIMVELMHSQGLRQASSNTGIRLQFRVPMYLPWRSQCHSEFDTLPPGTPR